MANTIIGYIPKKDIIVKEPFKEVKEETKKKTTRKPKEEKED